MMTAIRAEKIEPADDLERLLQLAQRERKLRDSPQWKVAMKDAFEAHSEAVAALYDELYRQLDHRASSGDSVHVPKLPPDPRKELKKQIVARLKEELPAMVSSMPTGSTPTPPTDSRKSHE